MILELYGLLLVLSSAFIVIGYYTQMIDLQMIGSLFLFVLGIVLLSGGVQYVTGTTEVYVYGDNFTGYHWDYDYSPTPGAPTDTAYLFHRNTTKIYSNYDAEIFWNLTIHHFVGVFLAIAGLISFILSLFRIRAGKNQDE